MKIKRKGNVLNEYKFLCPIGRGVDSRVHRARHIATGQIRAIKVIKKNKASLDETERIIAEVEILR